MSDTPLDRVSDAFDRVADIDDPAIFIETADKAAALDAADPDLPLAGTTFVVKNNIDVAGIRTTAGCPGFGDIADRSAPAVERLQLAGATCLGVTNLDQFATGLVGTRSPHGVPRNALDPALVPGGSSSGSAVAVARGIADFGLGTDTAGSGRVPAAHNRIVGLKPTRGAIPTRGVIPAVRSLDCVSIFARTIDVAFEVLATASGPDDRDPWSRSTVYPAPIPPTITVGVPTHVNTSTDEDARAWEAAVQQLDGSDRVELVEVDIQDFVTTGELLYGGPWVAERFSAVGRFLETGPDGADPTVSSIIASAAQYSAVDAYESHYRLAELRAATDATWSEVDVLFLPTCPGVATLADVEADPVGRNSELGLYTNFVNLLDLAALAVPAKDRADGRPFGISFVGPAWSETLLAEAARRFQDPGHGGPIAGGAGATDVVVVGAHLDGQPLNWQLTDLGGVLVRATTTAPEYRLHALTDGPVPKPALERMANAGEGRSIEVEVWRIPTSRVGTLLSQIPQPLGLGRIHLADGSWETGFIGEPVARIGAQDITELGGWRAYVNGSDG